MNLKKYWLFLYQQEGPSGGLRDLFQTTDSLQECRTIIKKQIKDDTLFEIFDTVEQRIIETNISDIPKGENTLYKWLNRDKKILPDTPHRSMFY